MVNKLPTKIQSIRLTGHDFLDIGTGDFSDTNYPDFMYLDIILTKTQEPKQFNEVSRLTVGVCSTQVLTQDGNFRVGELFEVEQATGTISITQVS